MPFSLLGLILYFNLCRMLSLNLLMQRNKSVDQRLQRDPVLPRFTTSLRGLVFFAPELFEFVDDLIHLSFYVIILQINHMQRRRDRINEKMKALQELIPRCNKVTFFIYIYIFYLSAFSFLGFEGSYSSTYVIVIIMILNDIPSVSLSKFQSDKASMLDEAIEYLKSLQLQVQVFLFILFV